MIRQQYYITDGGVDHERGDAANADFHTDQDWMVDVISGWHMAVMIGIVDHGPIAMMRM